MVICLERGADLHMAQLMPLPLAVSCFSKIQIGFTFLVPAHPGSPRKRAVKRVCVCVRVRVRVRVCLCVCVLLNAALLYVQSSSSATEFRCRRTRPCHVGSRTVAHARLGHHFLRALQRHQDQRKGRLHGL